jgi:uncharacterized repeat protein (TIGR01451 family)
MQPERNTLRAAKAQAFSQARQGRQKTEGARASSGETKRVNGVKRKRQSLSAKQAPRSRFTALAQATSSTKQAVRLGPSYAPPSVIENGGNVIAHNLEDGIKISSSGDVNNLISQNSIYSNGKLGINLVGGTESTAGVTDNDPGDGDDGPNHLQNFPVITDAAADTQTIYGTLDSSSSDGPFTIEFFVNYACDGSGNGEGKKYIGSTQTGVGNFSFTADPYSFAAGEIITATATDSDGNTSEFSSCFAASSTTLGADLYIEKTDSPDPVSVGNALTYTLTVFSNGPADAHNVVVTDTLPPSVTWVSSTPSQGSCSGTTTVTCNLGTISNGGTATVQIVVTAPNTPGPISNTASVSSPDDTVNENNTDSEDTMVSAACPSSFTVNDNGDASDATPGDNLCATAGAVCTLRAAIEEANALTSCGTIDINFSISSTTITLTAGQLNVDHNVNINGPVPNSVVVSGNNTSRVFQVNSGRTVSIFGLTISGGATNDAGGIFNSGGTLTLTNSTVSGNGASSLGGGIYNNNSGTLSLINSTVSGNSANGAGGIYNTSGGTLILTNSTVSGNNATNNGGGGVFESGGVLTLTNSTVSGNTAGALGGGIFNGGTVNSRNTIIAGNSASTLSPDINGTFNSLGNNLIGKSDGGSGFSDGANGDKVGSVATPLDPLLGPLQNNGGPTATHGLLYNSPAVDAGNDCVFDNTCVPPLGVSLTTDQRALSRQADGNLISGAHVDIGAYERQASETREVPPSSNAHVDLVDARLSFTSVPIASGDGQSANRLAPDIALPATASISVIDPSSQPLPPPGYSVGSAFTPPLPAFDVSASGSYTTPVAICFYLPSLTNASFFGGLKILHSEDGVLVDVTTGQNFGAKIVCGSVNSFSGFVIAHSVTPTAANGNVSGQIADSNGNPVEGAAVRLSGSQNRLTVTDANGNYRFENVETNGFYTVIPTRANFSFSPAQRSFSALGLHTEAAFNASPAGTAVNPLDTTEYFVRQQYLDFLGREPDEAGLNFWVNNIEGCGADSVCRSAKRIDTSAAFFLSIEFQQTGYLVYRTYRAAYGDMPGAPVPLKLNEFNPDRQQIGLGIVVNQDGWQAALANNKRTYTAAFVQRARFATTYPDTMTPGQFVDQLFSNAGVTPTADDRLAAINEFGSAANSADVAARGRALQRVAENRTLQQKEFNQAFVLMQYFGYLRRDANSGPDTDFSGYNFWLNKLNHFNGNFQSAEMVKAFLLAGEYRSRFPR